MQSALLQQLNHARSSRKAIALIRDLETGDGRLVLREQMSADEPLREQLAKRFLSGKSGVEETDGRALFVNVEVPAPRVIVIGAVHISQAFAPMAAQCGFDLTIIDPRTAFATPERFPDVDLRAEWPSDIGIENLVDPYTALAAITHDPKIDDDPLVAALNANCFYVGALGSRKTHGKRLDRLKQRGVTDEALARLDAPIGLDIGAASPAEIAVAILGQIIASLRKSDPA